MTTVCFCASAGPAARAASATAPAMRTAARSMPCIIKDLLEGGSVVPLEPSTEPFRRVLLGHEAPVHDHLRPGHERGLLRGQEERGVGDLARPADASEGDARLELRPQLVGEVRGLERCLDDAGMDDVAPDIVPGELDGERLVERDQSALGGRVGVLGSCEARQRGNGADQDDGAAARPWGTPYFVTQNTDFRLIAMTRSHWAPSVSSAERSRSFHSTPALL